MTHTTLRGLVVIGALLVGLVVTTAVIAGHGDAGPAPVDGTASDWAGWMESHMTTHMGADAVDWMDSHMGTAIEAMAEDMAEDGTMTRTGHC